MSQAEHSFTLIEEPRGEAYAHLIRESGRVCAFVSLVQRDECDFHEEAQRILNELKSALLRERRVSEWPGTRLLRGTALMREYELTSQTARVLESAVDRLFAWCQPLRPEDLVLWRGEGRPWLVTIAHEGDGYLNATELEILELRRRCPTLAHLIPEKPDPSAG